MSGRFLLGGHKLRVMQVYYVVTTRCFLYNLVFSFDSFSWFNLCSWVGAVPLFRLYHGPAVVYSTRACCLHCVFVSRKVSVARSWSLILQSSCDLLMTGLKDWNHCFSVLLDLWCWDPCGLDWTIFEACLQYNHVSQLWSGLFFIFVQGLFQLFLPFSFHQIFFSSEGCSTL